MDKRLDYVDMARGFAIILVVVAHLIQYNVEDGIHNSAFLCINSFHMPLFFAISGYIGQIVNKPIVICQDLCKYLKKKFLSLFVPLFVWELVVNKFFFSADWQMPTIDDVITTITHPNLWFLLALFRISVLYGLFQWVSSNFNTDFKLYKDIFYMLPVIFVIKRIWKCK